MYVCMYRVRVLKICMYACMYVCMNECMYVKVQHWRGTTRAAALRLVLVEPEFEPGSECFARL